MNTITIRSIVIILFMCIILFGCAGPKFMSESGGEQQYWGSIPTNATLAIKPFSCTYDETWEDKNAGELFAEILHEKVQKAGVFKEAKIVNTDSVSADLVLEGNIELLGKRGWSKRAFGDFDKPFAENERSKLGVSGRLIYNSTDKVTITFARSREAQGGVLGVGGWMAAGEKTMLKKLMSWLADDVVNLIKKANKK